MLGGGVAAGVSEEGSVRWARSEDDAEVVRAGVSVGVVIGGGASVGFAIGGVGFRVDFRVGFDGDGCGVGGVGSASSAAWAWACSSSGYLPDQPRRLGVKGSRLCTW